MSVRSGALWTILLAVTLLTAAGSFPSLADRLFQSGDTQSLRSLLDTTSPVTDDDTACREYYRARLTLDGAAAADRLRKLSSSTTRYGILAAADYSAWCLLQRSDEDALAAVGAGTDPQLLFWRAQAALNMKNNQLAGESALAFLKTGTDSTRLELARLTLAESRFRRNDFAGGVSALSPFCSNPHAQLRIHALLRVAYGLERLSKIDDARDTYRTVLREAPYTPAYFEAEENLARLGGGLPPTTPKPATATLPKHEAKNPPKTQPEPPAIRPENSKIYLQVGVFSSKVNARDLEKKLRADGFKVVSFDKVLNGKKCRVVTVGPFTDETKAALAGKKLTAKHIESRVIYR
jgi:hypothetical protein